MEGVMRMITERVYVSTSISKLGSMIPSVNLPPVVTCRNDAPCRRGCYGLHGRFAYTKAVQIYRRNLARYLADPDGYFSDIEAWLHLNPARYFRWHSTGDIVDPYYLDKMVELAEKHRDMKFLCFTKKYEYVNDYITEVREIPNNLTIVFSAWGLWIPENPYHLPMSYVRLKNKVGEKNIPKNAIQCSGNCGECVSGLQNCWNLKPGYPVQSVVFRQH